VPPSLRPALPVAAAFALLLAGGGAARAQYLETYFPSAVPGYDTAQGVTVLSRERPSYDPRGVRLGSFVLHPTLLEGLGFDSDVTGLPGGPASALLRTAPAINARSDWSRDALGIALSADNRQYFDAPRQNTTNWTASIGGGTTIGRQNLTIGYSYLSLNQNATEVGALPSDTPVHFAVNDVRVAYPVDLGRLVITPTVDVRTFQFDATTVLGMPMSQAYRDRVVTIAGAVARYELAELRNLLFVLQGVDVAYTAPQPGQPSNNATGAIALGGIDYQETGPWRYRLLVGVEERRFAAAQYATRIAPIAQGAVIWTPTGLTTVTATLARTIEEPSAQGSSGYVYTRADLGVDHELFRNLLLQARAAFLNANYLQGGGTETSWRLGGGVTWLLNRNVRLSLDYGHTTQSGVPVPQPGASTTATTATTTTTVFRDAVMLAVRLAL
jgi:hypothetical protein